VMSLRRVIAAMLILSGVGVAAYAVRSSHDPSESLPATVHASAPPESTAPRSAGAPEARGVPARIVIPAIGVNAPVMTVGVVNGSVGTPPLSDRNLAGWFSQSAVPGQAGPSLIDGHVNTTAGPSVFMNLKNLVPGNLISVTLADGYTARFRVTWTQAVAKAAFPWKAVLGKTAGPALRLVTCGGPFDYSTGHYKMNVIVFATGAS
jgi:sortase (surface protein transpeptidase)